MKTIITLSGEANLEHSTALEALATAFQDEDISAIRERIPPKKGEKELVGLTIALSISGLAMSAIATVISVLSYWKSTRPSYSVTVKRGAATITINNLSLQQIQEITKKLQTQPDDEPINVHISEVQHSG